MTALLEVEDLRVAYGKIEAVKGISFTVEAGQVVTLIGTNGAGKTTTLRTLSGLLKPARRQASSSTASRSTASRAHKIVALGLAHSPEGRHIFPRLTIAENLHLGAFLRNDKAGIEKDIQRAYDLFPILGERRKQAAGTLSGGEQQMLAMGRALMSQPKLLMLDEPSMGLSPIMMQKIMETIVELKASGHHDPARRAERPGRPLPRGPGPRHGDRQGRPLRHRRPTSSTTSRSARPTSARTEQHPRTREGPAPG